VEYSGMLLSLQLTKEQIFKRAVEASVLRYGGQKMPNKALAEPRALPLRLRDRNLAPFSEKA